MRVTRMWPSIPNAGNEFTGMKMIFLDLEVNILLARMNDNSCILQVL